jgi:hypothetical protein
MADPEHRDHQMYRDWIGGTWNPERFVPELISFSKPSSRLRNAGLI